MNDVNLMCKKGTGLEKLTACGVVTASSPGSMSRQFYTPIRFVTVDKNTKATWKKCSGPRWPRPEGTITPRSDFTRNLTHEKAAQDIEEANQ